MSTDISIPPTNFNAWCISNGYTDDFRHHFKQYVMQVDLEGREMDPPDYPGTGHAIQLFLGHSIDSTVDYSSGLTPTQRDTVRDALKNKFALHRAGDRFKIGKLLGGHWRITDQMAGAEGSFNRGIYRVTDEANGKQGVLKLLPTEAMHAGYAAREMNVQAGLHHPNIVELYDSHLPSHRHDTPWIITQYCDKFTLQDLLSLHIGKQQPLPELFLWQLFHSLLLAAEYCQEGDSDSDSEDWDPIVHRDIILGNVFLKSSTSSAPDEYPVEILLGDFGCAVTESEGNRLGKDNLPPVDYHYIPPEGAHPSGKTDIYQIGLIMWCFFCFRPLPSRIFVRPFVRDGWQPITCTYSPALGEYIRECLAKDPRERADASDLRDTLWNRRNILLESGALQYVPMPDL